MAEKQKPTPRVPPDDSFEHPDKRVGRRILDGREVSECDCGGAIVERKVQTGRVLIDVWDSKKHDSDEYRLTDERKQTELRVSCTQCGAGWTA